MKLSLLTAIAAGAVLVSASPLVIFVEEKPVPSAVPSFRFGHPVPIRNSGFNPAIVRVGAQPARPCFGARLRNKAGDVSAAFRKILGLPPAHPEDSATIQVLPHRIVNLHPPVESVVPHSMYNPYLPHPHRRPHPEPFQHTEYRFKQHMRNAPFMQRLHVALTTLGRWEGRAVAFVLGCGIGVLLRMIFVLAVVSYRFIKGHKKDENNDHEYREIIFVEEYEAPEEISAPPTYSEDVKEDKDKPAA